jgi:hypothetical protein
MAGGRARKNGSQQKSANGNPRQSAASALPQPSGRAAPPNSHSRQAKRRINASSGKTPRPTSTAAMATNTP